MIKSNFHTHTVYCDGADAPEELVLQAIQLGFTRLGFSGHAHSRVEDYSMSAENQEKYRRDICALKEKYRDKIEILCGIEKDLFSDADSADFDYTIASVHYVKRDGAYLAVDESAQTENDNIEKYYGGDFEAYAEDYYSCVLSAVDKIKPDIIGHLDLLMKFADINRRTETARYLEIAENCIAQLVKYGAPFEINTGAMARGYRLRPYPSENLLNIIKKHGGTIAVSSDCHDKKNLNFGFDAAEKIALKCDFNQYAVLSENRIIMTEF